MQRIVDFFELPLFEFFLQNLDPSLFQNVIIGILAIFIPFGIVFVSDILNSKEPRSEFQKKVFSAEVLGTKKVFWVSIIGIILFAFFTGKDISNGRKLLAILVTIALVHLYWSRFKQILRFSEGDKTEFEISFLKRLGFSKAENMVNAWNLVWSEKSESGEKEYKFTNIFISHIDDAITHKKFELVNPNLWKPYVDNIEKRDPLLVSHVILPKIFEWHFSFWNEKKLKETTAENYPLSSQQNGPVAKYFRNPIKSLLEKYKQPSAKHNDDLYHYFNQDFFTKIMPTLLKDSYITWDLLKSFKTHIETNEKNSKYVEDLFAGFCPTFFDATNTTASNNIWKDFPEEWKIISNNKDNEIARIILAEFKKWSKRNKSKDYFDQDLSSIINTIFPTIHQDLFPIFLRLFFWNTVTDALEKPLNLVIGPADVTYSFKDVEDILLGNLMKNKTSGEPKETIQIILNFWPEITINEWENMKSEIESEKIKAICENSELKSTYKSRFLELINLLITELQQRNQSPPHPSNIPISLKLDEAN